MNAVEEAVQAAAKSLCDEIDFSILADMLIETGWTSVEFKFFPDNLTAVDVSDWLEANCKGKYKRHQRRFIFENAADANWFKMRWLA